MSPLRCDRLVTKRFVNYLAPFCIAEFICPGSTYGVPGLRHPDSQVTASLAPWLCRELGHRTPRGKHCSSLAPGHCLRDPQALRLTFPKEQGPRTLWFGLLSTHP